MKLRITESERAHILGMHQSAKFKNLLKEDEYGGVIDLTTPDNQKIIKAKWVGFLDSGQPGPPQDAKEAKVLDPGSIFIRIPAYSWSPNEKFKVFVMVPKGLKLDDPEPSADDLGRQITFKDNGNTNYNLIYIEGVVESTEVNGVKVPKGMEFEMGANIKRTADGGGVLTIRVSFEKGSIVMGGDKPQQRKKRNFESTLQIFEKDNLEKPINITSTFIHFIPQVGGALEVSLGSNKYYFPYECGQETSAESGKKLMPLYLDIEKAFEEMTKKSYLTQDSDKDCFIDESNFAKIEDRIKQNIGCQPS